MHGEMQERQPVGASEITAIAAMLAKSDSAAQATVCRRRPSYLIVDQADHVCRQGSHVSLARANSFNYGANVKRQSSDWSR